MRILMDLGIIPFEVAKPVQIGKQALPKISISTGTGVGSVDIFTVVSVAFFNEWMSMVE